jgi:hypothetical protein
MLVPIIAVITSWWMAMTRDWSVNAVAKYTKDQAEPEHADLETEPKADTPSEQGEQLIVDIRPR